MVIFVRQCDGDMVFSESDPAVAISMLKDVLFFITCMLMFYMLLTSYRACSWTIDGVLFSTSLTVGLNIYETFDPGVFSTVPGRSAGFHLNPNTTGIAPVLGTILVYHVLPYRLKLIYGVAIGAGVIVSFSSEVILFCGLAILMLHLGDVMRGRTKGFLQSFLSALAVARFSLFFFEGSNGQQRVTEGDVFYSESIQHVSLSNSGDAFQDPRFHLVSAAVDKLFENRLLGSGTGSAVFEYEQQVLSAHNVYLSLGVQLGVVGLAILPFLFALLLMNPRIRHVTVPIVVMMAVDGLSIACCFSGTSRSY